MRDLTGSTVAGHVNFGGGSPVVGATDPGLVLQAPTDLFPNQQIPSISLACPTGNSKIKTAGFCWGKSDRPYSNGSRAAAAPQAPRFFGLGCAHIALRCEGAQRRAHTTSHAIWPRASRSNDRGGAAARSAGARRVRRMRGLRRRLTSRQQSQGASAPDRRCKPNRLAKSVTVERRPRISGASLAATTCRR